ncbi:DUF2156 domain-containing protein [Candidatus Woesearchaeota archaeon]|nr:DUF2156 domain-containing protein [Candidatus Woesearchaeota archaeon]
MTMPLSELRKVTLSDRETFHKFFAAVKEPLADTTFTMRFIWAEPLKHTWAIINGNLCVFGFLKDKYVVWGPPVGGTKQGETLGSCFDVVEKLNGDKGINANPVAIYIPECLKGNYEAIATEKGWAFDYWTQDYVYATKELIELKGKNFDSKRNKANFFAKNYDYKIEEFSFDSHANDCLKLIGLWREQKDDVISDSWRYELEAETEVARTVVEFSGELDVKGIVLKVEGTVAGISLGEQLAPNMCSNIIEKTKPALNGASEFIFREFARYWSSYELLNAQDDFGVDYLKRVKLSYHPARLLKSYCLEKR